MKPRLIHPVDVTIQRFDKAATGYDDTFREPLEPGAVYKEPETISAQVAFSSLDRREMVQDGETPVTSGYLLYERGQFPSLAKSDQVTAVDGIPLHNVFIISVEPAAAYLGRYHLEMAIFQERRQG